LAGRPASPNVPSGGIAFYYATDTTTLFQWDGAAWQGVSTGTGGASIASGHLLANSTAGSAPAADTTLTALIDRALGSTQGQILQRGAAVWQILAPGTINQLLISGGAAANNSWASGKYIIGASAGNAVLTNSQALLYHRVSKAVTLGANFADVLGHTSQAGGTAVTTASTVVTVDQAPTATPNTFTNIGSITFALGTVTPTFATVSGTSKAFAKGDVLRCIGPGSADATFAGFYCTIVMQET